MGTRNLTMVIHEGKTKVAQYGQWDGYPSGQGATCLEFLRNADLEKFKEKLRLVRFQTEDDGKELDNFLDGIGCKDGWMDADQAEKYHKKYPMLTRDNGAGILKLIYENDKEVFLVDSSDFAMDSLFCEWAYVIDLDNEQLEVYSGFNQKELDASERFYSSTPDGEYYGVGLVKKYSFKELPTEGVFVSECNPEDED